MRERRRWVSAALCLAVLVTVAGSWLVASALGSPDASGEAFAGTDSVVTTLLTDSGVQQWFSPLFEPGSPELESGLFALQAALGAGIFGYAVGRLHSRHLASRRGSAEHPQGD